MTNPDFQRWLRENPERAKLDPDVLAQAAWEAAFETGREEGYDKGYDDGRKAGFIAGEEYERACRDD